MSFVRVWVIKTEQGYYRKEVGIMHLMGGDVTFEHEYCDSVRHAKIYSYETDAINEAAEMGKETGIVHVVIPMMLMFAEPEEMALPFIELVGHRHMEYAEFINRMDRKSDTEEISVDDDLKYRSVCDYMKGKV